MADCPICGYQFAPFETKCPRCEATVKRGVGMLRSAPPARARPRGSGPGLWVAVGLGAALVLLVTGVVWYSSRGPVQAGSSTSPGLGSGAPRPVSPTEGGISAPAETQYGAAASGQPSEPQSQNALQQCPFSPVVGQGLRTTVGGDYHANWDGERLTHVEMGGWRLQAIGEQGLQLESWPDQPFELYKDGQLVGSFNSTAEYWSARE